ncbi:MAG TPA: DinB family protein [Pyrinomonadaceae bacterium]|jgi:hypothetical protein|nr:DinB family protein [Pyrinomonadaceae bacterium]
MSDNHSGGGADKFVAELEAIGRDAAQVFGPLSAAQLNWKPSDDRWSVGQCFEHLIKTNEGFFRTLEAIARGERRGRLWERVSPLSGFFGKMLLRGLTSPMKFKAPKGIRPSASGVDPRVVARFVEHQGELGRQMRAAGGVDLRRTVITSPISGFVTYSLGDACRIVVAHERRHFEQARRVTQAAGFPSS